MVGFSKITTLVDNIETNGKNWTGCFYYSNSARVFSGSWASFPAASISSYPAKISITGTALTATAFNRSGSSLDIGPDVYPSSKHITGMSIVRNGSAVLPKRVLLVDYLLYYPGIDISTAVNNMVNVVTLPRYTTGAGVYMFVGCQTAVTGPSTCTITYTNSAGTSGQVTPSFVLPSTTTSGIAYMLVPLAAGDIGVRSVQTLTTNALGTGTVHIVLYKPLLEISSEENATCSELNTIINPALLPVVYDTACLQILANWDESVGTTTAQGTISYAWS